MRILPKPLKTSLDTSYQPLRHSFITVLTELKKHFMLNLLRHIKSTHLAHNPRSVIALIRNWIEHLAADSSKECTRRTMNDQLSLLDKELKAEFED
ncbi:hypothetical protein C0991_007638, partial [Blastosporella zonata]